MRGLQTYRPRAAGKARRSPREEEHREQVVVFNWCMANANRWSGATEWIFAVPNGGDRHIAVAAKLKAEGVRRGVPDLVLPAPVGDYHGAYLEMKKIKGGTVSKDQRQWLAYLREKGYATGVAKGSREAIDWITRYLNGESMETLG